MELRPPRRAWVTWIAGMGVAHFTIAIVFWIGLVLPFAVEGGSASLRLAFAQAWPCLPLLAAFVSALVLNRRRRAGSRRLLVLALLVSIGTFLRDVHANNYTIQTMSMSEGCRHYYLNWWWYEGPGQVSELTHWVYDALSGESR